MFKKIEIGEVVLSEYEKIISKNDKINKCSWFGFYLFIQYSSHFLKDLITAI